MYMPGMLLEAQGSPALQQLTRTFGVSAGDALNAMSAPVPVLARGMQNTMARRDAREDLLGAPAMGRHQRHPDQAITRGAVTADGNAIPGHLFGGRDVSRRVATRAAAGQGLPGGGAAGGGPGDLLTRCRDADRDGSVPDDLMGMAGKYL